MDIKTISNSDYMNLVNSMEAAEDVFAPKRAEFCKIGENYFVLLVSSGITRISELMPAKNGEPPVEELQAKLAELQTQADRFKESSIDTSSLITGVKFRS